MTTLESVAGREKMDLVYRLRARADAVYLIGDKEPCADISAALKEAADTIDALREALKEARRALIGSHSSAKQLYHRELSLIDKVLTETSRCPHPAKGDPDNTTVRECIERGHCGCDNAKALTGERRL